MKLMAFGLGYSATAALRRLAPKEAIGTTRSAAKAAALAPLAEMHLFDGSGETADALRPALSGVTHIIVSIAPSEGADGGDRVLPVLAEALADRKSLVAIAYLSTVGVYGDHGGAWVDETSDCRPKSARSAARLKAESQWLAFGARVGVPVAVLRLSGIYGPGRNAFVNLMEGSARRLVKPGQVFNRIHVEDIAAAVERAFATKAGGLFNITDDEPAPPQDVVAYAAELMGVPPPPEQDFETADLSPMARSFYGENKRVANGLGKSALGLAYAYPNYRSAFDRMWAEGSWR
ncbi:NAD-dependent epimerase/dehydratase [uncultured Pleomorphomonas sp.]|uniref:NAD-dependent epimerase/dehydratase n=1 Tax=uncultured Pleomorphomonas sp. TaxID=442121 RepID=A0A212KZZ2_9HYPH|nr:SDR family oxidoreductase [uncultured Pleomorphomonas sp.]SCM70881.1 NAD-dependent epimerase/dehydratase [uncultured Pleomorphomonas sp.]